MRYLLWVVAGCATLGLVACGGGGASSLAGAGPAEAGPPLGANVLSLRVTTGPIGNSVNRPYASVTVCEPGGARCKTLDHVLVDSGSTGLRVLASEVSGLTLPLVQAGPGLPLLNCTQFVDNTQAWGPVVTASLQMAQKTANQIPIQLMGAAGYVDLDAACGSGVSMNTVASLGAQAILGVGLFEHDCGDRCASVLYNGSYFRCLDATCTAAVPAVASLGQQVTNPVVRLDGDNNGVVFELPAVGADGAATVTGRLILGIGTQSNNRFDAGLVLPASNTGRFITGFNGRWLTSSFIDSGSNALFFDADLLLPCPGDSPIRFYCPPQPTALSANLVGSEGRSTQVDFSVGNANEMFTPPLKAALPRLAGTLGDANSFNWGLPFFYGRRVFIAVEGRSTSGGTGPYYAY